MPTRHAHLCSAMFAVLLVGASGCGTSFSIGIRKPASTTRTPVEAATPQRPGTCRIPPLKFHIPTGEWTATETVLATNAINACAGERLVRPWDFRRLCNHGACKTYLYTVSPYGVERAKIVPDGQERYLAYFEPTAVPCPHRPGEDAGANKNYQTMTLWWSRHKKTLHGLKKSFQVGPCGGGPPAISSYVAVRTSPAADPPAEGP
jgi:hypothetical protein